MLGFIYQVIDIQLIFFQSELDFIVITRLIGVVAVNLHSVRIGTSDIVIGCAGILIVTCGYHHLIDTSTGTTLGNKLLGLVSIFCETEGSIVFDGCDMHPSTYLF